MTPAQHYETAEEWLRGIESQITGSPEAVFSPAGIPFATLGVQIAQVHATLATLAARR